MPAVTPISLWIIEVRGTGAADETITGVVCVETRGAEARNEQRTADEKEIFIFFCRGKNKTFVEMYNHSEH